MILRFHVARIVASIALAIVCVAFVNPARGDFQFLHGGHTYLGVTTPLAWFAAATDAAGRQLAGVPGELARIDDQAENDAIIAALLANIPPAQFSSTVAPDGGGGAYVWLGGTDRLTEGVWLWDGNHDGVGEQFWQGNQAGTSVAGLYQNWGRKPGQNEPDNFNNQDAAGISLNGWPLGVAGQWNDVGEGNSLYFLVEFPNVPEPSAGLLSFLGMSLLCLSRRSNSSQRTSRTDFCATIFQPLMFASGRYSSGESTCSDQPETISVR